MMSSLARSTATTTRGAYRSSWSSSSSSSASLSTSSSLSRVDRRVALSSSLAKSSSSASPSSSVALSKSRNSFGARDARVSVSMVFAIEPTSRSLTSWSRVGSSRVSRTTSKQEQQSQWLSTSSSTRVSPASLVLTPRRHFWVSDLINLLKLRKLANQPNPQVVQDFGQVLEEAKQEESVEALGTAEAIQSLTPDDEEYNAVFSTQSFNASLEVLLESENYDAVKDAFYIMLLKGIDSDALSWSIVIDSFKRSGTLEDFPEYVETAEWIEEGMAPEERAAFLTKIQGPLTPEDEKAFSALGEEAAAYDEQVFAPERPPERVAKVFAGQHSGNHTATPSAAHH